MKVHTTALDPSAAPPRFFAFWTHPTCPCLACIIASPLDAKPAASWIEWTILSYALCSRALGTTRCRPLGFRKGNISSVPSHQQSKTLGQATKETPPTLRHGLVSPSLYDSPRRRLREQHVPQYIFTAAPPRGAFRPPSRTLS
jgi:hypothetical protein